MQPDPQTDPQDIRLLAARLRAAAEGVDDQVQRVDAHLDQLNFHGPAALRIRAAMAERGIRARRIAGELRELAELAGHRAEAH